MCGEGTIKNVSRSLIPTWSYFGRHVRRHPLSRTSAQDRPCLRRAILCPSGQVSTSHDQDRWSDVMKFLKHQFVNGALAQGHDRVLVEDVYRRVAAFAAFGFCKAHAASFAHITYQSAYLKAHHPRALYIGLLNAGHVGSYPPYVILNEARRKGIPIYPPHINVSGLEYAAEGPGIRVPLVVVNNVGLQMARRIVSERNKRGLFINREDFWFVLSFLTGS